MSSINTDVACTVCRNTNLETIIDLGLQPPANRFIPIESAEQTQEMHPLALGFCPDCDTAQLTARMPIEAIRPQYSWLLYNEPEGHLDDVAEQLVALPGIGSDSRILGITYKDQSTIDRLAKLGLSHGICVSEQDFGGSSGYFGLETIQQLLRDSETIARIREKYGVADIVLMRHVLEHSENAADLLRNLNDLISPGGYIILELPDSEQIFKNGNHAFIWEEHISYFTEKSLATLASIVGANLAWFQRCCYPYEDSLLVAFRFPSDSIRGNKNDRWQMKETLIQFKDQLEYARNEWQEKLLNHQAKGEKVAIFGAGHLAVKFINFLNLSDLIDCVIDDNPNKVGMKIPGSLLPIVPSTELAKRGIRVCISTLSPESELKVRQKLSSYFNEGGTLLTAFTTTRHLT